MTIPDYLYDGIMNKTVYFTYVDSGSYSVGYKMEFMKDKPDYLSDILFLKMIPLYDIKCEESIFMRFNIHRKIYTTPTPFFKEEVKIQEYVHENKKNNLNVGLPVYDSFILEKGNACFTNLPDLSYFFKSLSIMEITDTLDFEYISHCLNLYCEMRLGIIIMPFIESTSGYTLYQPHITSTKIFGYFFNPDQIIEDIQNKEVKKNETFIFVQTVYHMIELYKMKCIHEDLHLGNLVISKDEIVTNQAFDKNGKINPIFVGRVYIIDYGNASIHDNFDKEVKKCVNRKKRSNNDFQYNPTNITQIIEVLGKKIIYDGYNLETKQMTLEWYLYDWFFNVFFDKQLQIKEHIMENFICLLKDFTRGIHELKNGLEYTIESTPIKPSLCCFTFFN
jgi:serine/threonine protein kinase